MNLDPHHMDKVQRKEFAHIREYLIPEGMTDPRKELEEFERRAQKSTSSLQGSIYPTKSKAAKKTMEQALNYQFKLSDLNKYSKNLRLKDIN
mmetsp:Transcript_8523/g.13131  ORF Transcript_8523/g.13131 Transcript_8523/m.13131 type:complete len:92 (-) Transcript_8523:752-1027(-)